MLSDQEIEAIEEAANAETSCKRFVILRRIVERHRKNSGIDLSLRGGLSFSPPPLTAAIGKVNDLYISGASADGKLGRAIEDLVALEAQS